MTDKYQPEKQLAKLFHQTYERLAPDFNYKTRHESAVKWEDVPENNKHLMIAVCAEVLKKILPTHLEAGIEAKKYFTEMNSLADKPNGFHELDFLNGTIYFRQSIEQKLTNL